VPDAKGVALAWFSAAMTTRAIASELTSDEARRIANGIARLPADIVCRWD
jgi:hypothetical protein